MTQRSIELGGIYQQSTNLDNLAEPVGDGDVDDGEDAYGDDEALPNTNEDDSNAPAKGQCLQFWEFFAEGVLLSINNFFTQGFFTITAAFAGRLDKSKSAGFYVGLNTMDIIRDLIYFPTSAINEVCSSAKPKWEAGVYLKSAIYCVFIMSIFGFAIFAGGLPFLVGEFGNLYKFKCDDPKSIVNISDIIEPTSMPTYIPTSIPTSYPTVYNYTACEIEEKKSEKEFEDIAQFARQFLWLSPTFVLTQAISYSFESYFIAIDVTTGHRFMLYVFIPFVCLGILVGIDFMLVRRDVLNLGFNALVVGLSFVLAIKLLFVWLYGFVWKKLHIKCHAWPDESQKECLSCGSFGNKVKTLGKEGIGIALADQVSGWAYQLIVILIAREGDSYVSAMGIMVNFFMMGLGIVGGITENTTSYIGRLVKDNNIVQAKRAIYLAIISVLTITIPIAVVFIPAPEIISSFYTNDKDVKDLINESLWYYCVALPLFALSMLGYAVLEGLQRTPEMGGVAVATAYGIFFSMGNAALFGGVRFATGSCLLCALGILLILSQGVANLYLWPRLWFLFRKMQREHS